MTNANISKALYFKNRCPSCTMIRGELVVKWLQAADWNGSANLTCLLVGRRFMTTLHKKTRGKIGVTDVLSFPNKVPALTASTCLHHVSQPMPKQLGDIVLCPEIIERDALRYNRSPLERFAHLVIHGYLHLLGYDHDTRITTSRMEDCEIQAMKLLGFTHPYL